MSELSSFYPQGNTVNVTVAATTTATALPVGALGSLQYLFTNTGTSIIFFTFGPTNAVTTAVTAGTPVLPGTAQVFTGPPSAAFVATIGATAGNVLYITPGEGI